MQKAQNDLEKFEDLNFPISNLTVKLHESRQCETGIKDRHINQ